MAMKAVLKPYLSDMLPQKRRPPPLKRADRASTMDRYESERSSGKVTGLDVFARGGRRRHNRKYREVRSVCDMGVSSHRHPI